MKAILSRYGFWGSIRLLINLLYTKLFFPRAKIIRLPFDIRNKKNIQIGKGFITGTGCRLEAYPEENRDKKVLVIGRHVEINDYVHITCAASVIINDDVLIASKVYISDINHGNYSGNGLHDSPESIPSKRKNIGKPVFIDEKVWIGESACILPGSRIGKGCIIGAMSLVNSEIPPYSIAVGVPAKVIKQYNFQTKHWEKVLS